MISKLRNIMARASAKNPTIELSQEHIEGLVQGFNFAGDLNFKKLGYARAGIAIQKIAGHMEEYYNGYSSRNGPDLAVQMKELGSAVTRLSGDKNGIPSGVLGFVVKRRDSLHDMIESRMNLVSVIGIEDRFKKAVIEVAGFTKGLNTIARDFNIGQFSNPDFNDDREYFIDDVLDTEKTWPASRIEILSHKQTALGYDRS